MREEYCPVCGQPVYAATEDKTLRPVTLDWMPAPYGAHIARVGDKRGTLAYVEGPHRQGAQYLLDMDTGWCRRALPIVGQIERRIYRQEHAATCAVWRRDRDDLPPSRFDALRKQLAHRNIPTEWR